MHCECFSWPFAALNVFVAIFVMQVCFEYIFERLKIATMPNENNLSVVTSNVR